VPPPRWAQWLCIFSLASCDSGEAELSLGPALHLIEYKPRAGEGLDCDPAASDCGFAANEPLFFAFDRWLLPSTANPDSIRVGMASTPYGVYFKPVYDLVTRSIEFRPSGGWDEGYTYDLQLYEPHASAAEWGFRAYDGQRLDHAGIPPHNLFRVGPDVAQAGERSRAVNCREALAAFAQAGCTAANCHHSSPGSLGVGAAQPRADLALDTAAGLADAVGRVARATDRGAASGLALLSPKRFGIGLPIIEPGEPAYSLVMYRMLLSRDAYRRDDGSFGALPPSEAELERARSWLGVMGPMPPSDVGWPLGTSPVEIVRIIDAWVRGGASTEDCL
jgi:hypothetical protein